MAAVVITEKEVMQLIQRNNDKLLDVAAQANGVFTGAVSDLNVLFSHTVEDQEFVTTAINTLIDNAPTAEQKTQLSNLLSLYSQSLDSINLVSRLIGNISSSITAISSSISKSNTQLIAQSAINMPVLP